MKEICYWSVEDIICNATPEFLSKVIDMANERIELLKNKEVVE